MEAIFSRLLKSIRDEIDIAYWFRKTNKGNGYEAIETIGGTDEEFETMKDISEEKSICVVGGFPSATKEKTIPNITLIMQKNIWIYRDFRDECSAYISLRRI